MIGALIGLILLVLVAGFCFWAIQQLLGLVPLAEPFATLLRILLYAIVLIIVIYAIVYLLGMMGVHVPAFGGMHIQ